MGRKTPNSFSIKSPLELVISYPDLLLTKPKARYCLKPRLALVKQFGLPDAKEQLSLFRLWLCENNILRVSQREMSFIFKTLFKHLVPSIVSPCSSAL